MTDLPDWTSPVQQSGSAYRGKVHVVQDGSGAASAVLDFELNTLDRAVLVFTPPLGAGISASVIIKALGPPSLITRQSEYVSDRRMVVGYASVELGTTWRVQVNISGPGANTYDWQVFTDQLLPIQELVYTPDYLALADNVAVPALPAFGWLYNAGTGLWNRQRSAADGPASGAEMTGLGLLKADGTLLLAAAGSNLGDSENGDRQMPTAGMEWTPHSGGVNLNAARWRRRRGRTLTMLLANAARTTSQFVGGELWDGLGVILIVDVTAQAGGSITMNVYDRGDTAGGPAAQPPVLSSVAIVAVGTYRFRIHPGITPVANQAVADLLTEQYYVGITANNANSITYSVEAHTIV